jgi:hypothetical protein
VPNPNKPKPFPYASRPYNHFWQALDKTTPRLDENSKLVKARLHDSQGMITILGDFRLFSAKNSVFLKN